MDFVTSPKDLERAWFAARAIDGNPLRLAGRIAGLGGAELDAGVPTWAIVLTSLAVGLGLGIAFGDDMKRKVGAFLK